MHVQVMIVGAGPAGSTLARELAAGGREVVLIEQARLPRYKPCGGGLPQRTLDLLPAGWRPSNAGRVERVRLLGAWRGPVDLTLPADTECLVVERAAFDAELADMARAAGANLLQGCRLLGVRRRGEGFLVTTSAGEIVARVLAACDGVFSPTGRALGFEPNRTGFCLECEVGIAGGGGVDQGCAVFHLGCVPDGYGWSFPRPGAFAVGVGAARNRAPDLPVRLRRLLRSLPELRAGIPGRARGGMLPAFKGARACYARAGAYLVGDAAGLVHPLTGEGIYYAMQSARLAARAMTDGGGESGYTASIRRELLPQLLSGVRLARWFRLTPPRLRGLLMSLPGFAARLRPMVELLCGR